MATALASLALGWWGHIQGLSGPNITLIVLASFLVVTFIAAIILNLATGVTTNPQAPERSTRLRTIDLANELFERLKKHGPEPVNPLSVKGDEAAARRAFNAYFDWKKAVYFDYMAHFRDRVVKLDYELAAIKIFTGLDRREIDPPDDKREVDLKKIAEVLLLTATQMAEK